MKTLPERIQCEDLAAAYSDDRYFRTRVVMAQYGFGRGEYKYFRYPLPDIVTGLRTNLYSNLALIANQWNHDLNNELQYPAEHAEFIKRCKQTGQLRPTPLLVQYGPGDYNCLHQDLYGEHVFPIQVVFLLSEPGRDFEGESLFLPNSARGCSQDLKSCRSAREMP